jgi:hypothetical protein
VTAAPDKIEPDLKDGISDLVKLARNDTKVTVDQKIAIYGLGLKAAVITDKVQGSRKGRKYSTT